MEVSVNLKKRLRLSPKADTDGGGPEGSRNPGSDAKEEKLSEEDAFAKAERLLKQIKDKLDAYDKSQAAIASDPRAGSEERGT